MKVALLSRGAHPLHGPGGMEKAVYHLARHLQARGVEILLFTRPATEGASFPGEVRTVAYGHFPAGRHGSVLDRTLNYPRFALHLGNAVAEEVRAGRVDLVHAQGLTALGYGRLRGADPRLLAPLVMNPQGMEEHKTRRLKRLALSRVRSLSREAARLSDRVIATDLAMRDEVPRLLGVPAPKVVVLPNGIDPDEIQAATPAEPRGEVVKALPILSCASTILLSVGRLEAYKGFDDVGKALGLLKERHGLPEGWVWVAVGEGPLRDVLRRGQARLGERSVVLPGRVSERLLHGLYASADVFIHAPQYEGSSLVTLEAMAHGVPVVATRTGGIPDKVREGETGRLVEPGDAAGLARAIEELVGDATLRRRLGEAGRQHALAHFNWAAIADRTLDLYRDLLHEERGRVP